MAYAYISCTSYTDYLIGGLNKFRTYYDDSQIDKTIKKINEALDYEKNNYPDTALSKIKEIFPEV